MKCEGLNLKCNVTEFGIDIWISGLLIIEDNECCGFVISDRGGGIFSVFNQKPIVSKVKR